MRGELFTRFLGLQPYSDIWARMRSMTDGRNQDTSDELWMVQHPAVFTLGQAGKREHLLNPHDIDVIQSDRGGQVTYHGPGQLVAYPLLNLRRLDLGVRQLVTVIESAVVEYLASLGIHASPKIGAPGVYVNEYKIASLGLRVRRGFSFHGVSLNVSMDLTPFTWINPCGYEGLQMTQIVDCLAGEVPTLAEVQTGFALQLAAHLGYSGIAVWQERF